METTGDVRAYSFLFQRITVVLQRFNSVLLHVGFVDEKGALPNNLYFVCQLLSHQGFFLVQSPT